MGFIMKHGYLIILLALFSNTVFAECKTVMGGCPKEDVVNVSPHMRSEYNDNIAIEKKFQAKKPATTTNKMATADSKSKK
jgi:hypothetical protein